MKKNYEKPILEEETIVIEDICATSGLGELPGDSTIEFPWGK